MRRKSSKTWQTLTHVLPRALRPILLVDGEGMVQSTDSQMLKEIGGPSLDLTDTPLEDAIAAGQGGTVRDAIRACIKKKETTRAHVSWKAGPDGSAGDEVSLMFSPLGKSVVVIAENEEGLSTLQKRMDHHAQLLAMHCEVAHITTSITATKEALEVVLRHLASFNGWQFGHALLPDDDQPQKLVPAATIYSEDSSQAESFREYSRHSQLSVGEGLPGRVAETGKPILHQRLMDHVPEDPGRARHLARLIETLGVCSAYAFPIFADKEVVGVMEFFSTEEVDEDSEIELDSIAAIGLQVGRVIERERAHRRREEQEKHVKMMTQQINDAVWTYDPKSLEISYANPASAEVWKLPRHNLKVNGEAWSEQVHAVDRPRVLRALSDLRAGVPMDEEFRIVTGEGKTHWIRCRCFPIHNADESAVTSIAATAEEITERKDSQATRARLERELRTVTEQERQRAARNLHDDLGGLLSAIDIRVESLRKKVNQGDHPDPKAVSSISELAREAMTVSRRLTRGLAPVGDDPDDLIEALREMAENANERGEIECAYVAKGSVPLSDPQVANQLFRIAKEALNNALKHSKASRIEVELVSRGKELVLRVFDDGCGFDQSQPSASMGVGLSTMKYRAQDIGADLEISPGPEDKGTQVICRLPVDDPD
ncbi:MAG: GAF domain-containing protein [Akkermansiaceae bacterium]|nr:GAF domain-containing protein [Akkermansiaceae bacterium]